VNFKRLNHILIPRTKADRDRFRRSRAGRIILRVFFWLFLLTDEGRGAVVLWLAACMISLNIGSTQYYYLASVLTGLLGISLIAARWFAMKPTCWRRGASLQTSR
jgi:hypothetical protein